MCCITDKMFSKEAENDIYVYKVFDTFPQDNGPTSLMSPMYGTMVYHCGDENIPCGVFERELSGEHNKTIIKGTYKVEYGFHSFENKEDAVKFCDLLNFVKTVRNDCVYKCRIKKGTHIYYGLGDLGQVGSYKCYVSEYLDIVENINH